jgi:hypothetical protein
MNEAEALLPSAALHASLGEKHGNHCTAAKSVDQRFQA